MLMLNNHRAKPAKFILVDGQWHRSATYRGETVLACSGAIVVSNDGEKDTVPGRRHSCPVCFPEKVEARANEWKRYAPKRSADPRRDPEVKFIGGYLDKKMVEQFTKKCAKYGWTVTARLNKLVSEDLEADD